MIPILVIIQVLRVETGASIPDLGENTYSVTLLRGTTLNIIIMSGLPLQSVNTSQMSRTLQKKNIYRVAESYMILQPRKAV